MRKWIRHVLPRADAVRGSPSLRWAASLLDRPGIWSLNRRAVAAGAAIGVFFSLTSPVAQIPLSAVAAMVLRANLPAAVLGTFLSNPLTAVPILLLAYQTGAWLQGTTGDSGARAELEARIGEGLFSADFWADHAGDLAMPLALGLLTMAVTGAAATYCVIRVGWSLALRLSGRRGAAGPGGGR